MAKKLLFLFFAVILSVSVSAAELDHEYPGGLLQRKSCESFLLSQQYEDAMCPSSVPIARKTCRMSRLVLLCFAVQALIVPVIRVEERVGKRGVSALCRAVFSNHAHHAPPCRAAVVCVN